MKRARLAFLTLSALACLMSSPRVHAAAGGALPGENILGRADDEDPKAFLRRVKGDLKKVDASIEATKKLNEKSKDSPILPDVELRLAELYVEKSRLLYYQAMEERGTKSGGEALTAPDAKYFKELAIEQYKRILKDFPAYPQNDKLRFYLGHEYQELSQTPEMLKEYGKLTTDYPDSPLVPEAFLILGNFYFEKRDMETAKQKYLEVVKKNDAGLGALAHYKLGWIAMNIADYKEALANFEAAARAADSGTMAKTHASLAQRQKLKNVRREALTDSVQPFTETRKPEEAVAYYGELADTRNLYAAILEKLGNRYYVQQNWGPSGRIYRVLVALTHDTERSDEFGQRFYECVVKALKAGPQKPAKAGDPLIQPPQFTADDAIALTDTMARYSSDWRVAKKDRDDGVKLYEQYVRDIGTRLQIASQKETDPARKIAVSAQAARAYKAYLSFFRDPAQRPAMEENYAEVLAASTQHWEAGKQFEHVARIRKETERDAIHDALAEYHTSSLARDKLGRFRRVQAREGEKQLGEYYAQTYPDGKDINSVEYNVAKTFYDEGDYQTAIQLFRNYVKDHPGAKESYAAANLVLDSYAQSEDFPGLSNAAKGMIADPNLPDPAFKRQVAEIGKQADFRRIGTLLADTEGGEDPAEKLARLAESSAGNELGEKALYTLFVTNRDRGEADRIFDTGERYLARYPAGEFAGEILNSISRMAVDSADFGRAAAYFEAWAKTHPKDKGAATLLERAASIREKMGDANRAAIDYLALPNMPGGMGARDAAMKSVMAYRAVGDWPKAAEASRRLIAAGGDGPLAHFTIGFAAFKGGNAGVAKQEFETAVVKARQGVVQSSEDKDAAAEAGFILTEDTRRAYEQIQFANAEDAGAIEKKFGMLQQLEAEETEVVKLGSGEWAIAALYRVGQSYKNAAEFLRKAPVPASLTSAEEKGMYAKALDEKALPIDAKAKQAFLACVNKGNELKVSSPWLAACAAAGTRPDPALDIQPPPPRGGRVKPPADLTAGLQKDPLNADLLLRIAQGYLSSGDPYTAELIARRALEADESRADVHGLLAMALLKRGLIADAGDEFAAAAERAPGMAKPWLNLAAHQYAYGDPRKAVESLKRADNPRAVDLNGNDIHPGARKLMIDAPRLMAGAK